MPRSRSLALFAILGLAAILRAWGIGFGLPHTLARPDEDASVSIALKFFSGSLHPGFFDWPSLFMYAVTAGLLVYFQIGRLLGWFPDTSAFMTQMLQHPAPVYLIARGVSAVAGVATVATVYATGVRLFDRSTALVGAFFLACAALHARDSHFGVTDIAATSLVMLSFLFTVRYAQSGRRGDAIGAAVFAGLAASTKYNAALILVPAAWAILSGARLPLVRRVRLLAACGAVAMVAFFLGTPYALIDWPAFVAALVSVSAHLRSGHAAMAGPGWTVHLASSLRYGLGVPLLVAGVGGLVAYAWQDRQRGPLFLVFPIVYYAFIGIGQTTFARYIIPVVPFLCLAAAHLVVATARTIGRWLHRPEWTVPLAWVFALVVAAPSAITTIRTDRLLARTDNRLIAAGWIHQQYPDGTTIAQTGSIAGQVQMITADPETSARYRDVEFDEASGVFRVSGVETAPEVIVLQECPLSYCDVSERIRRVLRDDYQLQRTFVALDSAAPGLVYDRDDAFYLPLAGFSAVERPGPTLTIYRRRSSMQR